MQNNFLGKMRSSDYVEPVSAQEYAGIEERRTEHLLRRERVAAMLRTETSAEMQPTVRVPSAYNPVSLETLMAQMLCRRSLLVDVSSWGLTAVVQSLLGNTSGLQGRVDVLLALFGAAEHAHFAVVEVLLLHRAGLSLYMAKAAKLTVLMLAVSVGHTIMLENLLADADIQRSVNHVDAQGWSALMLAAKKNSLEHVRILLAAGADLYLRRGDGGSVFDCTTQVVILELLCAREREHIIDCFYGRAVLPPGVNVAQRMQRIYLTMGRTMSQHGVFAQEREVLRRLLYSKIVGRGPYLAYSYSLLFSIDVVPESCARAYRAVFDTLCDAGLLRLRIGSWPTSMRYKLALDVCASVPSSEVCKNIASVGEGDNRRTIADMDTIDSQEISQELKDSLRNKTRKLSDTLHIDLFKLVAFLAMTI